MESLFKKIKSMEIYEIIKDQSAIIIFIATLLGSFVTLSTKINIYLYDLGRFIEFNIPIDLINAETFSFYDIVKTFALIICYVGGILTLFCIRMIFKSGISVAKLEYKLFSQKQERRKTIIRALAICIITSIILLSVDGLTILISSPASKTSALIVGAFLIIFQWIYSGHLVKEADKRIEKTTIKKDEKDDNILQSQNTNNLTDEDILELANETIKANKSINYFTFIFPIVVVFFLSSVLGISSFTSGQASTKSTASLYQILSLEEKEYVVLDKTGDNYILAKKIDSKEDKTLIIDTGEQRVVSIVGTNYKLEKFDNVILEEPK